MIHETQFVPPVLHKQETSKHAIVDLKMLMVWT